jgi:hypothetical protein
MGAEQKMLLYERLEDRNAGRGFESKQSLGLRRRQPETRRLFVFGADSLQEFMKRRGERGDAHEKPHSRREEP